MHILVVFFVPLILAPPTTEGVAFSRSKDISENPDEGRMQMCPPGGKSFTHAWAMACSSKRKRSVDEILHPRIREKRELVAPTIRQLHQICCIVGCLVTDLLSYCTPLNSW